MRAVVLLALLLLAAVDERDRAVERLARMRDAVDPFLFEWADQQTTRVRCRVCQATSPDKSHEPSCPFALTGDAS